MPRLKPLLVNCKIGLISIALLGCSQQHSAMSDLPSDAAPATQSLAILNDDLNNKQSNRVIQSVKDAASGVLPTANDDESLPALRGMGYSQVSTQPGKSLNERRLLAIRAARLEAMRDLVEQVHGIHITSSTKVRDTAIQNDMINAMIEGQLRGAKTISITPSSGDTFEVILELDPDTVAYIVRSARSAI